MTTHSRPACGSLRVGALDRRVWQAAAALSALLVAACGSLHGAAPPSVSMERSGEPAPIVVAEEPVVPALPVTVTSADGREVTVADTSRIIPLSGNIAEILFGLGLGNQVVARDVTATFPEAQALPIVTRAHDVSAESVLSLNPTLVLASVDTGPASALDHVRNVGIPVVQFEEPTSVEDVIPRMRAIAAAVGVPRAGEKLVGQTEARLAEVRAAIPASAMPPRVAFLYMRGQAAVYLIAGPFSGADSMIRAAGGVDAGTAMGLERPFTPITSEALVLAAPDVILMTTSGLESVGGIDGLLEIRGIAQTPAGKHRRVITLEDGLLYSFGPRTAVALRLLVSQLYGDSAPPAS